MPKPVSSRDFVSEFKQSGWTSVRSRGSHEMFECVSGQHKFVVPSGHKQVSGGVVQKGRKSMKECEC